MERIDQFAELLSEGWSLSIIQVRMRLNRKQASAYFDRICKELGAQAA